MLYTASDRLTTTKNMIILDAFESYVPGEESPEDFGRGRWQGTFDSVDVSDAKALGADPVVYYNTSPVDLSVLKGGDQGSGMHLLPDPDHVYRFLQSGGWTTEAPEDPSTVRAIAVDLRHKADGSEFELKPQESCYFTVRMRAGIYETSGEDTDPFNADEELRKSPENNDYAYNNVYMGCTNVDPVLQETYGIMNYNYTRVGILPFEFKVKKVWDDAGNTDGRRPNAVTVRLLANGSPMDPDRTLTLSSENDWTGVFSHVIRYDDDGNWINYTFEEESADPNPAFRLEGYTQTTDRKGDEVTITNTHVPEKTSLKFKKVWEGDDADEDKAYRPDSVTVRLKADGVFTGKTATVKPDRNGNWAGSFSGLPKYTNPEGLSGREHEIEYTVEEEPVYRYLDTYQKDPSTGDITITNRYWPFGDLVVAKTTEGTTENSQDKEFTFTLVLKDPDGEDVTEKYEALRYGRDGEVIETLLIGNGDTFTLKGGEHIAIVRIPSETRYEVAESETPGFTMVSSTSASGTIRAGAIDEKAVAAGFTNRYEAEGSQTVSLYKTLEGRKMTRYQFRFELVDMTDGSDTYGEVVRNTSSEADGSARFSRLTYDQKDHGRTFTYQIREVDREKPGYIYDKDTYTVKVTVTDNGDGTMTCVPEYFKADGTKVEDPEDKENGVVFRNEYHATGSIGLKAWKQVRGGELGNYGPFQFELLGKNAEGSFVVLQTKECNEAGTISFDELSFDESDVGGTYLYVIREKAGSDARVVYDDSLKGVELSVADNGDGTLAVTQTNVTMQKTEKDGRETYEKVSETSDLPVFVNTLEPGSVSVTKLTKWSEKEPDGNISFPFTLSLVGEDLPEQITVAFTDGDSRQKPYTGSAPAPLTDAEKAEKTVDLQITSPDGAAIKTGVYEFTLKAGQTFTAKDIPAGIAYQFRETIPTGWTLEFENVADTVAPKASIAATYTNTYEPGTAVATFIATKRLDGTVPPAGKFAFELIDDNEGSPTRGQALETLCTHASGYVLFDQKYTSEGTYHYLIREVQGIVESVAADGTITYSADEDELRRITFDESSCGVTVIVTKTVIDGNENLNAAVTYDDGEAPQFNNSTNPGSLQIVKVGSGLTEANKDAEFTFKVKLTNDAGMPIAGGPTLWYSEKSAEKPEIEALPEDPALPEDSEPAPQQAGPKLTAAPGRSMSMIRSRLAAPLKAGADGSGSGLNITPSTTQIYRSGTLSTSVKWTLYQDGTLIIEPTNGISGSFQGKGLHGNEPTDEGPGWPWHSYRTSIKQVSVSSGVKATGSLRAMFRNCYNLVSADLSRLDTSEVNTIVGVFWDCRSLARADVTGLCQDKCVHAYRVFDGCSNLTQLDVSTWDTSECTSFYRMFSYCPKLTYLDLSSWDVRKASSSFDNLFDGCTNLSAIKLGENWTFKPNSSRIAIFNTPPSNGNYTGKWQLASRPEIVYTPSQLQNNYNPSLAGTWVWQGAEYTIAFDPNGATGEMDPITTILASEVKLPECTFQSDLLFAGWSTDPDAVVPEYEDGGVYTGGAVGGQTVTLYAVWMSEDSFLLNYDANGGYSRIQWQRVNGPDDAVEMPVPTHPNGYEFLYWTTGRDGSGDRFSGTAAGSAFSAEPGSTVKLYAQYMDPSQRAKVTVEHYQQKADLSGYLLMDTDHLGAFDLGASVLPEKREYKGFIAPEQFRVLAGSATTGVLQDEGTEVTVVKGGVTVRWYYDRTQYKLVFDPNGGEGTMADKPMTGGVAAKLPVNRFTKEDAIFVGWNTEADGSGTAYGDGQSVNSIGGNGEEVRLYAQWFSLDEGQQAEATGGEYTVFCKAGETIIFPDLPAGTRYEITETDLPAGWTLTGIDNASGTILSAERVTVTADNSYSAYGYADITAYKSLPGETIRTGQFTFQLLDEKGQVIQTAANDPVDMAEQAFDEDGSVISNPNLGKAPVHFDAIRYEKQGVYRYRIREVRGSDAAIKYDAHEEEVVVVVKDRGNGRLAANVIYDRSGAAFRNDMSSGDLKVSKTIVNATPQASETEFTFTLYFFDSSETEIRDEYPVTLSTGAKTTVKSGGAVSIKGGESFTVTGLPHNGKYIVTEVPSKGFELVAKEGDEGVIKAGETAEASFTNAYTSRTKPAEGGAVIEARKVFTNGVIGEEQFSFRLTASDGSEIETVFAQPDGTVTFSPLHYSLEDDGGRFVYYIEEIKGDDPEIKYDEHKERVSVTVSDNGDGTMTAQVIYEGGEEAGSGIPVFTNYTDPKKLPVRISKVSLTSQEELEGAAMQILDKDGNVVEMWISGKEPHVTGDLDVGAEYALVETAAPYGYALVSKMTFAVDKDGKITTGARVAKDADGNDVIMVEDPLTRVGIAKVDAESETALEGAVFRLLDKDGNTAGEWTSGSEPHIITGLRTGAEYTITETEAPEGYQTADDVTFTIAVDGSVNTEAEVKTAEDGTTLIIVKDAKKPAPPTPLETVRIDVKKIWKDNDDRDGARPDRITVILLAGGKEAERKTVTAEDGWTCSFEDLPKFDEDKSEIKYTVAEEPVEGYKTSVEGFDIINTRKPEEPPKPGKPEEPEPEDPDEPGKPDKPVEPPKPQEPGKPDEPPVPVEPPKPGEPDEPPAPPVPEEPAKPQEPQTPKTGDDLDFWLALMALSAAATAAIGAELIRRRRAH
ncbi:MAG: Cna B-type domain-containing protein [Firmicutes bacterium]|nr:Cna B-type domain-containing protein [Bacillota bacterium]